MPDYLKDLQQELKMLQIKKAKQQKIRDLKTEIRRARYGNIIKVGEGVWKGTKAAGKFLFKGLPDEEANKRIEKLMRL